MSWTDISPGHAEVLFMPGSLDDRNAASTINPEHLVQDAHELNTQHWVAKLATF